MKLIDKEKGAGALAVLDMLNPFNKATIQENDEEVAFVEALRKRTQLSGKPLDMNQLKSMLVDLNEVLEPLTSNNV